MKQSAFLCLLFFVNLLTASTPDSLENGNLSLYLKQLSENQWGVFVLPDSSLNPTELALMGTGQVTLVVPAGFTYYDFKNHGGTWVENARVTCPVEARDRTYLSFGFIMDSPKVKLCSHESTLLFSFMTDEVFHGTFELFENGIDPFETPNSYGTNPGNDLGMIDRSNGFIRYYMYNKNMPTQEIYNLYSKENPRMGSYKVHSVLVSQENDEIISNPK